MGLKHADHIMAKKKKTAPNVSISRGAVPVRGATSQRSAASQGHSVVNYSKWDVMASALSDDEDSPNHIGMAAGSEGRVIPPSALGAR